MKNLMIFCIIFSLSLWAVDSTAKFGIVIKENENFIKALSYPIRVQFTISPGTFNYEFVEKAIDVSFFAKSTNGYQVSVYALNEDYLKGDYFLFRSDTNKEHTLEYSFLCPFDKRGMQTPIYEKGYCCPGKEGGTKLKNGDVIFCSHIQDLSMKEMEIHILISHDQLVSSPSGSYTSLIRLELVDY